MGAINKDALLKRIAFAAVMGAVTARAASRRNRTVCAIDEAHDYLGDSAAADAFLGKAYAKMRKFDVAMWTISQKFEDFQRSRAAPTIIGNSFLKLATTGQTLTVNDYFTMYNEVGESSADLDLGSGGEMLLPDLTDATNTVRHLVIGAGKDANIYLVNRDLMGKYNAANNTNVWQELAGALPGGIRSTPAYFNNTVYFGETLGTLKAYAIVNAKLVSTPTSQTALSLRCDEPCQ